uniref:Reverse transcriptase zinc-binding domain-containing protein n=1 Tax=Lactuca sativa TaxID=4236 RepID=A0A9R1WQR6_LACSA|nr:hypothetical protein LSAT_V11C900480860 [Lactuca sativa]
MADCGNQFIVQTKLIDIPLGGPRFTSIDKGVPSLVSWIDLWLQKNILSPVDLVEKDKNQWGIEGDENSGFFHGMVNQKRRQLAICVQFIHAPFSRGEIKRVIWDCGSSKSPGPNGLSFGFIKRYWDPISDDMVYFVTHFYSHSHITVGCIASFFTVIVSVVSL